MSPPEIISAIPQRITLQRRKGWRKPAGVVVAARPSRLGNPFRVGVDGDRAECVAMFGWALAAGELGFGVDDVRRELAGRIWPAGAPLTNPATPTCC